MGKHIFVLITVLFLSTSAIAADKVVVIPLNTSKSAGERPPAPIAYYTSGTNTLGLVEWPEPRFIDGANVVIDNLTGIMWQKYRFNERVNQIEAANYCHDLVIFEPVGISYKIYIDWVLPSKLALLSLVDDMQVNPALPPGHPFEGFGGEEQFYWAWDPVGGSYSNAWCIDYYYGQAYRSIEAPISAMPYVRCVRYPDL